MHRPLLIGRTIAAATMPVRPGTAVSTSHEGDEIGAVQPQFLSGTSKVLEVHRAILIDVGPGQMSGAGGQLLHVIKSRRASARTQRRRG